MNSALRLFLLGACLLPMATWAQTKSTGAPKEGNSHNAHPSLHDQFTGQGYGLAGCGLGSVVFGPKPGMVQVAAATTNSYFFPQTFAISSATSNCDIPEMGQQAAMFIEINRETLNKEVARGSGETVDTLATILKCSDRGVFGQKLRANYSSVMEDGINSYEKTRRILQLMKKDSDLKNTCQAIG